MRRANVALTAFFAAQIGVAQQPPPRAQSPTEVLRSIQQSSDDIEQLRTSLQSPNPSVRVAAFNAMVDSNNPSLVTIAINEGHASADATLRDLSSRAAFRQIITFDVQPSGDMSANQDYMYFVGRGDLRAKVDKYDPNAGMFTLVNGFGAQGQISGTRLVFKLGECQGNFAAIEGSWTYEGPITCTSGNQRLAAKMHVNIR